MCCRFSLDETFDVGIDIGSPVIENYATKMPSQVFPDWERSGLENRPPRVALATCVD